jgi:ABC-type uncharacterized transport system permease subunit
MQEISTFWLRAAVALYAIGLLHAVWTVLARRQRFFSAAFGAFSVGTVLHMVSIVERWRAVGHVPVDGFFESASVVSFLVAVVFLFLNWRYKFHSLGVILFPLVFAGALVASMDRPVAPFASDGVRDTWLVLHIVFVLLAYAALVITAVASIFYLIQERRLKRKAPAGLFERLPPLGTLDSMITRAMGLGFLLITLGTVMGVTWAFVESGTSWLGDNRVTIAVLTWFLCLVMVFLRTSAGWRGRRAAVMSLVIVGCLAVTWATHSGLRPAIIE